ncbi:MAG TPA: hypothetical protein ENI73_01530, partial [Spirochaetes bacterium]|nr:hypothetical protein [Spirochaetota bacterium]
MTTSKRKQTSISKRSVKLQKIKFKKSWKYNIVMIVDGIELDPNNLPKHIAIIMDGNKRWAQENSVSVMRGHREGLERVIESLGVCEELGISVLTLFAFSTENWKRSSKEISGLLKLFKYFFDREFKNLKK